MTKGKTMSKTEKLDLIDELVGMEAMTVTYDQDWVGEPPNRHPVENRDRIRGVQFLLSAVEWCDLCMCDGDHYLGGCCGNMSRFQDILNHIFRDNGVADARHIRELMDSAFDHEGLEVFSPKFDEGEIGGMIDEWNSLDPVTKIGVCCRAVGDKLTEDAFGSPYTFETEPEDFIRALEGALQYFSFKDIVQVSEEEKKSGQHQANMEHILSRIVPAARKLLEVSIPLMSKPFKGVAIVKKGTEDIQMNRMGLCIYRTEKDAQRVIDLWKKDGDRYKGDRREVFVKYLESIGIRPVTISADGGIVWG